MKWIHCRDAFHQDGSLRDLLVLGTTENDWNELLSWVHTSGLGIRYTRDAEETTLPTRVVDIVGDQLASHNLAIDLGGVILNCHFFTSDEIELDLDPRQVNSQADLDNVLNFMSALGSRLSRDVILTEENSPKYNWFTYSFRDRRILYERAF